MTHGPAPVELLADCPACGLEAGVVEIYDPFVAACRFGVPARATCKLCDAHAEATFDRPLAQPLASVPANRCPACLDELGVDAIEARACGSCRAHVTLVEVRPPRNLASGQALGEALDAWAMRDGFASRGALLSATFADADEATLLDRITRRAPLEVLADPFANMGVRTTGKHEATPARAPSPPRDASPPTAPVSAIAPPAPIVDEPAPRARTVTSPPPSAPPRAIVYPLVSVIAADGEVHPRERELIDRFLVSEGLLPLAEDEFKVHHPSSVAHLVPAGRREAVVQLMCETAAIDGMPDESERRVILAYAVAWGVPDEKIDFWLWGYESMNASLSRQLWLKIRRFVLSARWESPR